MKKFISEFKEFIMRGNVVDMAVGVVIGGAFREIISVLVQCIITPLIGILIGKVNISQLSVRVGNVDIFYGMLIQSVINFLIIAFSIFCVIKFINVMHDKFTKKKEIEEAADPSPSQEELLAEIRDLLKEKNN